MEKHFPKNTQSLSALDEHIPQKPRGSEAAAGVWAHRLPHAVVDERSGAGHAADAVVLQLQLQPSLAQSQHYPCAVSMASSKEKDTFRIKGSKVELSHKSDRTGAKK